MEHVHHIVTPMCGASALLTLHGQGDWLAGLVLAVLVVDRLDVVASGVRRHGGQDDERVLQGDGAVGESRTTGNTLRFPLHKKTAARAIWFRLIDVCRGQ